MRPIVPLFLALATTAPGLAAGTSVSFWTDRETYERLEPDGSPSVVRMFFRNDGPRNVLLHVPSPWTAYDELGHRVYVPGTLATSVEVPPGTTLERTWDFTSRESDADADQHGSMAWSALARLDRAGAGGYRLEWLYSDDRFKETYTIETSVRLVDGVEEYP